MSCGCGLADGGSEGAYLSTDSLQCSSMRDEAALSALTASIMAVPASSPACCTANGTPSSPAPVQILSMYSAVWNVVAVPCLSCSGGTYNSDARRIARLAHVLPPTVLLIGGSASWLQQPHLCWREKQTNDGNEVVHHPPPLRPAYAAEIDQTQEARVAGGDDRRAEGRKVGCGCAAGVADGWLI